MPLEDDSLFFDLESRMSQSLILLGERDISTSPLRHQSTDSPSRCSTSGSSDSTVWDDVSFDTQNNQKPSKKTKKSNKSNNKSTKNNKSNKKSNNNNNDSQPGVLIAISSSSSVKSSSKGRKTSLLDQAVLQGQEEVIVEPRTSHTTPQQQQQQQPLAKQQDEDYEHDEIESVYMESCPPSIGGNSRSGDFGSVGGRTSRSLWDLDVEDQNNEEQQQQQQQQQQQADGLVHPTTAPPRTQQQQQQQQQSPQAPPPLQPQQQHAPPPAAPVHPPVGSSAAIVEAKTQTQIPPVQLPPSLAGADPELLQAALELLAKQKASESKKPPPVPFIDVDSLLGEKPSSRPSSIHDNTFAQSIARILDNVSTVSDITKSTATPGKTADLVANCTTAARMPDTLEKPGTSIDMTNVMQHVADAIEGGMDQATAVLLQLADPDAIFAYAQQHVQSMLKGSPTVQAAAAVMEHQHGKHPSSNASSHRSVNNRSVANTKSVKTNPSRSSRRSSPPAQPKSEVPYYLQQQANTPPAAPSDQLSPPGYKPSPAPTQQGQVEPRQEHSSQPPLTSSQALPAVAAGDDDDTQGPESPPRILRAASTFEGDPDCYEHEEIEVQSVMMDSIAASNKKAPSLKKKKSFGGSRSRATSPTSVRPTSPQSMYEVGGHDDRTMNHPTSPMTAPPGRRPLSPSTDPRPTSPLSDGGGRRKSRSGVPHNYAQIRKQRNSFLNMFGMASPTMRLSMNMSQDEDELEDQYSVRSEISMTGASVDASAEDNMSLDDRSNFSRRSLKSFRRKNR